MYKEITPAKNMEFAVYMVFPSTVKLRRMSSIVIASMRDCP